MVLTNGELLRTPSPERCLCLIMYPAKTGGYFSLGNLTLKLWSSYVQHHSWQLRAICLKYGAATCRAHVSSLRDVSSVGACGMGAVHWSAHSRGFCSLAGCGYSVAYPMISISYLMVMLLARFFLNDQINWAVAGAALVFIGAGVTFIGLGLGRSQERGSNGDSSA